MINMQKREKKGQITIFIIIAIVIVGVLIFMYLPQIKKLVITTPDELIPKECIGKVITPPLSNLMLQGGAMKPQLYYLYNNKTVDYLCYTGEWYKTCYMQKPFLKQSVELELTQNTSLEIQKCMNTMVSQLQRKDYNVQITGNKNPIIKIIPDKVLVTFNMTMTIQKGDEKMTFNSGRFQTEIDSNSYEMIMVASSIQNFEARFGDSVPETYMSVYPNIKVQKLKQADGTKIYIITDRKTNEKLVFATRSVAWPPGMAINPQFPNTNIIS